MTSSQGLTSALDMPASCFDLHPGRRLKDARAHLGSLTEKRRVKLARQLEEFTFRHCAYSIPAWGLMVLPGPGRASEGDPADARGDWRPGLAESARHFAEFPDYMNADDQEHYRREENRLMMWRKMRKHIGAAALPGVAPEDRFACWGLVNLTTEHAPSEATRAQRKGQTQWDVAPLHRIIMICRPALIIAPPSRTGGARCHARLEDLLQKIGGQCEKTKSTSYPAESGRRTWDFRWWDTPWGRCRVGKMHTQPSYWSHRVSAILTQEAKMIAAQSLSTRSP